MPHIHDIYDFTASGFIIHPSEAKILLLKHKKIGKWLQPGGHIELNENPVQALTHEIEEETGLKPNQYTIIEPAESPKPIGLSASNYVLPLPFYMNEHFWDGKGPHKHIDICYLIKSKTEVVTDDPDGASAIGWFDFKEIQELHRNGVLYEDTMTIAKWIFDNKV
jgi:8-oxo-dGTP pyrophosphatase MutT (NUDIX family)